MQTRFWIYQPWKSPLWLRHLALLAGLLPWSLAGIAGELRVQNGHFVDSQGAPVVLRGFNLSQHHKFPPFRPNTDPALAQKLAALGVNLVRLQFNWEAYEQAPGLYDESYLDYYAGVLEKLTASDMHVLVDIHQDAFSRWSLDGCGEGFPRWAIPPGFPVSAPDNGNKCAFWPVRVMLNRNQVEAEFNAFYTPGYPARERYLLLLEKLAQRFASNPKVVGYDLLNEPLGDARLLMQLYREGITRIRQYDADAIAFLSPEMLTGAGIEKTQLPAPAFDNVAFAPHYYDLTIYGGVWLGIRYEPVAADNRARAASWNGAAVLLGEFGAPAFWQAPAYIGMIYDDMDRFGDSGTQWTYTPEWNPADLDGWNREDLSILDDKGQLRSNYQARPFARRTAGKYGDMKVRFSGLLQTAQARYQWTHIPAKGRTEIFAPSRFFAGRAPVISTQGTGLNCHYNGARQTVYCASAVAGDKSVVLR